MDELHYNNVPEETLRITLPSTEGLHIKGILRGSFDQPLVVMMHGRSGGGNSLLQYLGARYLFEHGFASLRLFMYDSEPGTRNIVDCTLDTHVADFETVITYLRAQNTKLILATGHSYGGMTIIKSNASLNGAVLWDPTHGTYWVEHPDQDQDFPEKTVENLVIGLAGKGYVLPRKLTEYDQSLGDTTSWAAHKGYPLEVISAGKGAMTHLGKRYIEVADSPKKHVVLTEAHHQFEDSDDVTIQLFKETADWFKEVLHG